MFRFVLSAVLVLCLSPRSVHADDVLSLDDLRGAIEDDAARLDGKVVYVDFWASWCVPCRASVPWLKSMSAAHRDDGLEIVTITVDRKQEAARRFVEEMELDLPVITDPQGELAERFALEAMPTAFVFDRMGTLRHRHEGFRQKDTDALETLILELIAEDGPAASGTGSSQTSERTP